MSVRTKSEPGSCWTRANPTVLEVDHKREREAPVPVELTTRRNNFREIGLHERFWGNARGKQPPWQACLRTLKQGNIDKLVQRGKYAEQSIDIQRQSLCERVEAKNQSMANRVAR